MSRKPAARYGKVILIGSGHRTGARLVRPSQDRLMRKFALIQNREYVAKLESSEITKKRLYMIFKP
jgi:hypothetical protein